MTSSDDKPASAKEEAAQLKNRMEDLSNPMTPAVARATGQAKQYAQQTQAVVADRTEDLSASIRQAPWTAMLMACGTGYLLGRIVR